MNINKLKEITAEKRLLIVDDSGDLAQSLATIFNKFFKDVIIANDGLDGLNKYKNSEIDVVITDYNMPNMNGEEMILAIKEINKEQYIILTTAFKENLNIDDYKLDIFSKPTNIEEFINGIINNYS